MPFPSTFPTTEQARIVGHDQGPLLVLATVGSGKTMTLTARTRRLLDAGACAERILGLTFTNRAADNLREAIAALGADTGGLQVRTFHGFCAWLLRQDAQSVGLPADFWIFDEEDAAALARESGAPADGFVQMQAEMSAVELGGARPELYFDGRFSKQRWVADYVHRLTLLGAVDFGGLVLLARAALAQPDVRARWQDRFDHVSVDELQDTHLSEYDVLRVLARNARTFVLCGDLDQTIYSWRGSNPAGLLARMERDFGPIPRLPITENQRSTRALVAYADGVARRLSRRDTAIRPAPHLPAGSPPTVVACADPQTESQQIAQGVKAALSRTRPESIAVLTRTNSFAQAVSTALTRERIPHATVESYRFFRRQEIKDALALLRLCLDPQAEWSARRLCLRVLPGVGEATIRSVVHQGDGIGLRTCDLLHVEAVRRGDPLWGLFVSDCVVLDTETTGFDPEGDDIVEIAAIRLVNGRETGRFQAFLRPRGQVGESTQVHGYTDAFLATEGRSPAQVIREFAAFVGELPVVGHNLGFDLGMLAALARRGKVRFAPTVAVDTLAAARRLLRTPTYRLSDLARLLELPVTPSHQAMSDVEATVHLRAALARWATPGRPLRQQLIARHERGFAPLRTVLADPAKKGLRPAARLELLAERSGLLAAYAKEPDRLHHIAEMRRRMEHIDDPSLPPDAALRAAIDRAALARDADGIDDANGVRVITVHQSKGLEFDEVFVGGLCENGFPSYFAVRDRTVEEECRLFYVAVTRARRALHLSWPQRNERGFGTSRSRFLA